MSKKKTTEAKDIHVSGDFIAGNQYNYYYTGDFASLTEYYISPEPVFQRVRTDDFIGRDWLTAKVDAFLNDPNRKSGAFLLIGDAGVGKTSFMAHLVKERRYLHLFAEQAPGQAMLQRAMQSLGSQLVTRYQIDPYKDRDTLNALSVFPDFLERILRLAASTLTEGEKIVIVCDALDEAGVFPDHFVFGLPKELPNGVYLILTQRPVNVKLPNFEPMIEKLEAQGEGNLQDIEAYLSAVAKRPEVAGQIRSKEYSEEFFIQTLKEKSQGVWMYLHYIIKEIESGARAPLDLANLPTGLVGYYAEYWDAWRTGKRGKGEEAWDELYAPLLTTLAAAQEAIPVDWLIQWADMSAKPREVTRLLTEHWRAFVTEKEVNGQKAFTPYHLSFKDFITGRVDTDKLPPAQTNLVKDLAAQTVDAHKRIVNAFEQECNGEWEKLVKQDYPRLHLSAHLAGAGEHEKLRILLTEGDEKIKWAEAREKKEETYAGYLNDLTYVWAHAEREQNYALAIRCMLIENSIHSLAANIAPKLIAELGKTGLWSYARCLTIIRQKPDTKQQMESLSLLAPNIPTLLYQEALTVAREIQDESNRASALSALLPYLPEDLKAQALVDALVAVHEIREDYSFITTISILVPYLPDELKKNTLVETLSIVCRIQEADFRVRALSELAPHLPDELKVQAFVDSIGVAREIHDEYFYAIFLGHVAAHLPDNLKTKALTSAREIRDESIRVIALYKLALHLSDKLKVEVLNEAVATARAIRDEDGRSGALTNLAANLSGELKAQVIVEGLAAARDIQDKHFRANALSALVPYLPDEFKSKALNEALAAAREIPDEENRIFAFSGIIPHLPNELKAKVLIEALAAMLNIRDNDHIDHYMSVLTPYILDNLKIQVLALVREIGDEKNCAIALSELAHSLPSELKTQALSDALAAMHKIRDENDRVHALSDLAPYLQNNLKAEALSEALVAAREIQNEDLRCRALFYLAPHLLDDLKTQVLAEAFTAGRKIKDEYTRTHTLSILASHLPDNLKAEAFSEALIAAREIRDEDIRFRTLAEIAHHLPNNLKTEAITEVLATMRERRHEFSLDTVFSYMAPYLPDEVKAQLFTTALEILDENVRANALSSLAPFLSDELKTQALVAAHDIKDKYSRARILSAFASHLHGELKAHTLIDALTVAREIQDSSDRVSALSALVSNLLDERKKEAIVDVLVAVREIRGEYERADALIELAPHLSNEFIEKALNAAYEIHDPRPRASVLVALTPCLPNELKVQAIVDGMVAADEILDDGDRAFALSEFAPYLDTEAKKKSFQARLNIDGGLKGLIQQWEIITFNGLEEKTIPFIKLTSRENRSGGLYAIASLTPALVHFRGPAIADELYRTITDVTRWWP